MIQKMVVAGAGTMGSGIALNGAQCGKEVVIFDIAEDGLETAKKSIGKNLDYLIKKEKITADQKTAIENRISFSTAAEAATGDIIIEAIVEKMEAKVSLLTKLAALNPSTTIIASNTSSLSINTLQEALPHPERVAGMHFFNPANIMKLVEVVSGKTTAAETVESIAALCVEMKKVPVHCIDSPGFIVNRVARHFYLEALQLVEDGLCSPEQADAAIENAGFKMGPFTLMDLIGMDINLAVSQSLYDAYDSAVRFKPSALQAAKVAAGELGKKTGKGFYTYNKN
jgi:3-hydroxybutyryl-CoA dehydrogenase